MDLPLLSPTAPAVHARPVIGPSATRTDTAQAARLSVRWARHLDEVRAAQRLRYAVFADEMGARLAVADGMPAGHDIDAFDAHCEHLLVCASDGPDALAGEVVGTYRVLTPAGARQAGGLYSDGEFDLSALDGMRDDIVELGRSCVAPEWRQGGVILALWAALGEFMQRNRLGTMVGCASVGMRDGGHAAASLWLQLQQRHLAPAALRVTPRLPLPVERLALPQMAVETPPLIKGYLRCGAQLLGAPAWDPDFNTADLPLLMRLAELPARYRRHFMGS